MSGVSEATAAMANRDLFTLNSPGPVMNTAVSQPRLEQQMHMAYTPDGSAGYRQVGSSTPPYQSLPTGATMISHSNSADQKRKRGRPRKYGPDGNMNIPMTSQQPPLSISMPQQQPQTFSPTVPALAAVQTESNAPIDGSVSPTFKKARGRPRGSKNKKRHIEALGSHGIGFVPHVLNVNTGELLLCRMCLQNNGHLSEWTKSCLCSFCQWDYINCDARQAAISGGTATYEGRFDILSLSGSFMLTEVAGQKSRTGGLSVALAGPDGSVLGGSVAGLLIAASPAQVIVGSFLPDCHKEVSASYVEPSPVPVKVNPGGGSSSPSRGTLSESSGGAPSPPPLNLSSGGFNNIPQGLSGMPWK